MSEHYYRYSIIPGMAVTDPSLEGRDLQVLCLLGRHTDKDGWCFRSQVKMAGELHCSRSTVQRSLDRLIDAGWAEKHERHEARIGPSGRPHSYYAYRVKIDRSKPTFDPSKYVVDDGESERGCPPVGTSPPDLGTRCPPIHGHQEGPPFNDSGGTDSRAREALAIADEIAAVAGVDPANADCQSWFNAKPGMRILAYLNEGYTRDHLIAGAQEGMAGKRDGPPRSIEYFKHCFARAKGRAEAPVPQAIRPDERRKQNGTSRDNSLKGHLAKLQDDIERLRQNEISGSSPDVAGLLPER